MPIFVVLKNQDGTEWCCTSKERWSATTPERYISHDVDGTPMLLVEEFEAKDWPAAMRIYNRRWDKEDSRA